MWQTGPIMSMFAKNTKPVIESREEFWKKKTYKTVEKGKGWKIERPYKFDLEASLEKLFKRKEKWE